MMNGRLWVGKVVAVIVMTFTGSTPCASAHAEQDASPSSRSALINTSDNFEGEISPIISSLERAINEADAAKASELWSVDGVFIDDAGQATRGRQDLKERFARAISEKGRQGFTMHPDAVQHPSANVGLLDGVVLRQLDGIKIATSRFSMVLIKDGGKWQIAKATETLIAAANNHEHLQRLAGFIGKWSVARPDRDATVTFQWAANHNFINSVCVVHKSKQEEETSTQVIGWDARTSQIVSWHFDAEGGFAYGKWTDQDNKWIVNVAGVTSGGSSTVSTDTFTLQDANHFIWQSTNRLADGVAAPDSEALTVERITQQ